MPTNRGAPIYIAMNTLITWARITSRNKLNKPTKRRCAARTLICIQRQQLSSDGLSNGLLNKSPHVQRAKRKGPHSGPKADAHGFGIEANYGDYFDSP